MKRISIIVPVYNVAQYLSQCIVSLLQQTFNPSAYEIILVDDGSTDNSPQICRRFALQYPKQINLQHKKNGGLSDARNYGLQFCSGKYVLFIDADDYVEPRMLERMYALTDGGHKKMVECNFWWEFPDQVKKDLRFNYLSLKDYLIHARVVAWNKLYLRQWLLDSRVLFPKGRLYEDQAFFFKTAAYLNDLSEIAVDQLPEVHYRQRCDSISYSEASRLTDIFWIYQDILNFYQDQPTKNYQAEIEYRFCRNLLGNVLLRKVRHLKNQQQKRELQQQIWRKIAVWFPNWKKNPYLKQGGAVNLYLRLINPFLASWLVKL